MKKIYLAIIMIILSVSSVFAQSTEFTNHMEKAKEYENKKQYVSALGEYYDAMTEEKSLTGKTAYESWMELSDIIKSGKPGYGDFDDFSFVDEWIRQLQEFEKYWTENCPIMIICDEPERIQLNREEKTATYEMKLSWKLTPKYKEIESVFKSGLEKAYTSDWQMPFLEKWPYISVYNTTKDKNKFLQNGTALVQNLLNKVSDASVYEAIYKTIVGDEPIVEKSYVYSEFKYVASLAEFGCIKKNVAGRYNLYEHTTLYDVKLKIIDDAEQEIFSGKRVLLGPVAKYTFTVNQQQMQKIDNKKVKVVPDSIFLQYGNIPTEPWITEDSRDWIKTLSELKLDNNNVQVIFKEEQKKYEISSIELLKDIMDEYKEQEASRILKEEQQRRLEEEKKVQRENYLRGLEGLFTSLIYTTSSSYPYPIGKYIVKTPTGISDAIVCFKNIFPEYDFEQISYALRLVLCNEVSKYENLDSAYSIPEENAEFSFTDKILFYLNTPNAVTVNLKTKGYKVPDQNEKDYLLKKRLINSQLIDYVIIRNK